jgi:hypothetical protein
MLETLIKQFTENTATVRQLTLEGPSRQGLPAPNHEPMPDDVSEAAHPAEQQQHETEAAEPERQEEMVARDAP